MEDERKAKKAEWYKAGKKKPKTDDEELQEAEEIKSKAAASLKNELLTHRLTKVGREIDILRTKWLMDNHDTMDSKQFDELMHLESVLDIDIAGKDLIVRLDLDVPLSKYIAPPIDPVTGLPVGQQSLLHSTDEVLKSQGSKGALPPAKKGAHKADPIQAKPVSDEPWKKRDILDHTLIKRSAHELRYLQQDRGANRTFILGNLSDKAGKVKPENSLRIVHRALQKQLQDQPLIFVEDALIKDFESKLENEIFPEQTTFILENLNFKPDEYGYVEADKPLEDPNKPSEEELKRIEEEKLREAAASSQIKGGPAKAAPAKPPAGPADKKKEEEAKKKAEEEAAAKKKAEESLSSQKSLTEEERAEIERQREEAERKKREAEYFDYKTIHAYKELLGRYGAIYVNDAPLATLTNSNSISEIKCSRKVMGVKMTEELRKLCQFFLKKHPSQITDLWYNKPQQRSYFEREFACVIGGTVGSVSEILDRILLVNSLIDTCKDIYLGGQFGLAALHALGVKVGHVDNMSDFEQTAEFFQTLFVKCVGKKARLHFPLDLLTASPDDIEKAKHEQIEHEALVQQQIL